MPLHKGMFGLGLPVTSMANGIAAAVGGGYSDSAARNSRTQVTQYSTNLGAKGVRKYYIATTENFSPAGPRASERAVVPTTIGSSDEASKA